MSEEELKKIEEYILLKRIEENDDSIELVDDVLSSLEVSNEEE